MSITSLSSRTISLPGEQTHQSWLRSTASRIYNEHTIPIISFVLEHVSDICLFSSARERGAGIPALQARCFCPWFSGHLRAAFSSCSACSSSTARFLRASSAFALAESLWALQDGCWLFSSSSEERSEERFASARPAAGIMMQSV